MAPDRERLVYLFGEEAPDALPLPSADDIAAALLAVAFVVNSA
jgi:hypothetical protein